MRRFPFLPLLFAVLSLSPLTGFAEDTKPADAKPAAPKPTDYAAELERIQKRLVEVKAANGGVVDAKVAYLLFGRASLTANYADFKAVEEAIEQAFEYEKQGLPVMDLHVLKAQFDFKLHRLASAKDRLRKITDPGYVAEVRTLQADIDLQEGRYDAARKGYQQLLAKKRRWDDVSRLAYLESRTGNVERADRLYGEAQDELTAKELRPYAWVELQRGLLDLDHGRHLEALAHYLEADKAFTGYWLIEEHIAEVLDLLGRTGEAVALYRDIIKKTGNPEFVSALAGIVGRTDPAAAEGLYEEAERLFAEQYKLYPEAALGHYLKHLIDRKEASPDLVPMAERNHRLRPNGDSKLLLAKAYFKVNQVAKARALLDEIQKSQWRTPELARFTQEVRGAAGGGAPGK